MIAAPSNPAENSQSDPVTFGWRSIPANWNWLMVMAICWLSPLGCSYRQLTDPVIGASYQPSNFHQASAQLPPGMRRVAILPLTVAVQDAVTESGRDTLEPVLQKELSKTRSFDIALITRDILREWTGRTEWAASDSLPDSFFKKLVEATACDAVLFSRLTQYRSYPPVSVGWQITLVDAKTKQIVWAVEEVFDAGETPVANAARRYYQDHIQANVPLLDSRSILLSPRQFGHYSAWAALSTLPTR